MTDLTLTLTLPGFRFHDLFDPLRLRDLHAMWEEDLHRRAPEIGARYEAARQAALRGAALEPVAHSTLLLDVAPFVSEFVASLFGLTAAWRARMTHARSELVLFRFKDEFVKRRAMKHKLDGRDHDVLLRAGAQALERGGLDPDPKTLDDERAVARVVCRLLDRETELKARPVDDPELVALRVDLATIEAWVMARRPLLSRRWVSYQLAHPLDYQALVEIRRPDPARPELLSGPEETRRARDGFRLTDRRMDDRPARAKPVVHALR